MFFVRGFPGSSADEESTCNVGDLGLIPGLGSSPGEAWCLERTVFYKDQAARKEEIHPEVQTPWHIPNADSCILGEMNSTVISIHKGLEGLWRSEDSDCQG